MDRGSWRAAVHGATRAGHTEPINHHQVFLKIKTFGVSVMGIYFLCHSTADAISGLVKVFLCLNLLKNLFPKFCKTGEVIT